MKNKWIYDIFMKGSGFLVGTQGDYEFYTKEEAEKDAKDYIANGLIELYDREEKDFRIECHKLST